MKVYLLLGILFLFSCNEKSNHDIETVTTNNDDKIISSNYDFELPCDTLTSQLGMNICTGLKSEMIDSLVNVKYNCFKKILENDYKQSILEKDTMDANYNKHLVEAFEDSQASYLNLAKTNRFFYNNLYEGGSSRAMMANLSAIEDGLARLKKMDGFINSIYGDDCQVCK